jgi:hypothetical protein
MSTTVTGPVTARWFLFGKEQGEADERLAHALDEQGVGGVVAGAAGGLARSGRRAVCDEVGRTAGRLLDLDLGDVLVAGWQKHGALQAAGRRTLDAPSTEELVQLATHKVSSVHRPYVEVDVDGLTVARVQLELKLSFLLRGVLAVVRKGRLEAVRTGSCEVSGSVACEGRKVAERKRSFEVPVLVRLGDGVSLLPTGA